MANQAIEQRPAYAEAYNNVAAALNGMKRWDEGVQAARKALELKPGYEAAKSNLDYALEHQRSPEVAPK